MLRLYRPAHEDLWFRQAMLADAETMAYNHAWGGTIPFPEEDWAAWYEHWLVNHEWRRFYRYLQDEDGAFVGEIALHHDADFGGCLADVIIYAPYRGRGFGSQGLALLCAAAKESGLCELYDDIAEDNGAIALFLRQGFEELGRTDGKIILRKRL